MPLSEATGWGRPRLRDGGERSSRLRSSGRVSNYGAANRCTHFSRPHLQGAVGRYMNCQVRVRLMLRTKLLRCVGPTRARLPIRGRIGEVGAPDQAESLAVAGSGVAGSALPAGWRHYRVRRPGPRGASAVTVMGLSTTSLPGQGDAQAPEGPLLKRQRRGKGICPVSAGRDRHTCGAPCRRPHSPS